MTPRIFVALSTFAQEDKRPQDVLRQSGLAFEVNVLRRRLTSLEILELAANADGIVAGLEPYDATTLVQLAKLKCISRCGVGVDNVDLKAAKERGIVVLNTPDVVIAPVAELTVGFALDLFRKITWHTQLLRQKKWERHTASMLQGKTIGVWGLGRIGRRVAELFKRLDCTVVACDIRPDVAWCEAHQVRMVDSLELLSTADLVTLHMSSDSKCPFVLGQEHFSLMKKGSYLINVARGGLVDEKALGECLQSGHLAGAALDVFAQEPYAGPLMDLPNVIATPHMATLTKESRAQMELESVENVVRFFKVGI